MASNMYMLAEALNGVLLALFLENIGSGLLESLCIDGELQLCHEPYLVGIDFLVPEVSGGGAGLFL